MSATVPLLPPGQPQSKAAPTAQLVTSQAAVNNEADAAKPVQSDNARAKMSRMGRDTSSTDPTSRQTTLALIQRVLVPNKSGLTDTTINVTAIEDILPPLTSSNDVDLELYAILAIIVKDFVNTWYTKITPDHDFVEEIIQIFAHCSRALEQRLRQIDRTTLFMDEVPLLIQHHLDAYRTAKSTTLASPHTGSLRQIYHELMPHPALTPVPLDDRAGTTELLQQSYERAYRQLLVQGSLGILLPTEDLQNGPLRVLVGDIVADLIIGQALAGKIAQAWFLHDAVRKATALVSGKIQPKVSGSEYRDDAANRLQQFGLLSSNSAPDHRHSSTNTQSQMVTWFWRIMQYGYMVYLFSIFVLKEAHTVRSKPARVYRSRVEASKVHLHVPNPDDQSVQPVIAFGVYAMISTLLRMADRIPWTTGILEFCQHILLRGIGHVGRANSYLDR
ncbi:hypothetical protein LTR64_004093 [Lithohypha guttulata]|uniref:uncharacterized protein n=1 Tax=Lithohypha guttulata TaxID=1690604 RepID=UPI002DE1C6C9|nr:hypothetical protein LTR51_006614 [Lithohypha guttulata]